MLNTMMESSRKFFCNILIFLVRDHGTCDYDSRKEIEILVKLLFLFSIILFNMMALPGIL